VGCAGAGNSRPSTWPTTASTASFTSFAGAGPKISCAGPASGAAWGWKRRGHGWAWPGMVFVYVYIYQYLSLIFNNNNYYYGYQYLYYYDDDYLVE